MMRAPATCVRALRKNSESACQARCRADHRTSKRMVWRAKGERGRSVIGAPTEMSRATSTAGATGYP